jgi:gamma-glutamylcyclotransferase
MKLPVVGKAHEAQAAERDFHWFIYGSSLDRAAFDAWAKEHGYVAPDLSRAIPARLEGYRLAFDVVSKFWGGAVGTPVPGEGAIEGIAVKMPATARGLVDHKEGAISNLFEAFDAKVIPLAGGEALDVVVYRAIEGRRQPRELEPAPRWLETVIAGARGFGLSAEWIAGLQKSASRTSA